MGKDIKGGPAFPFYAQDFLVGVMHLENNEIGGYIKLLAYQWVKGPIPKNALNKVIGNDWEAIWEAVSDKFDSMDGFYYNYRLESEREKRGKFINKQSANGSLGGRPKKPKQNPNKSQKKPKQKPLENENESENEKEIKKENVNKKIDNQKIVDIFNSVCKKLPPVKKLTPARNSAINNRINEYDLKTLGDVFILVSQSPFLNGDNDRGWHADFDWIMKPANFIKILENNYNGKKQSITKSKIEYSETLKERIAKGLQS